MQGDDFCPLPELRVVNLDRHCVLDAVGVLQSKLEELSRPQHSIDSVSGGDGLAQHLGDALALGALPVGIDHLQVPQVLQPLLVPALRGGRGQ